METRTGPSAEFRTVSIGPVDPLPIDLFGITLTLASHKWLIAGISLAGAVLTAMVALRMQPVYTASAVLMPPSQSRSGLSAVLGQLAPVAGALTGGDLTRSPSDMYVSLLGSRSVADGIIQDQQLLTHYRSPNMTQARRGLAGRTRFTAGKDSLIKIDVRDADPKKAADVANAYMDQLYKLTSRFAVTESAQRRTFYQKQLNEEKQALAGAEAEMRAVQERTGLLQVNSQAEVVIRSVAQLRAEITSREVMLEGLRSGATDQNPQVIRLQTEIQSLRDQLREIESSQPLSATPSMVLPAGRFPGAGLQYMRALRELRYHESLFEALARQYEAARIDEAKQATVVQVVDYAIPPELKTGPRRTLMVLLAAFSFAVLAAAFVLIRKSMTEASRAARFQPIFKALWSFR